MGAQGDRQARARRARGLLPRPHDGGALDHRPAGQAGRLRAARPGRPLRDPRDARRRASAPQTAAIILEPVLGEGGVLPARPPRRSRRRARSPTPHGAMLVFDEVQTGHGPHRARSSPGSASACAPTRSRSRRRSRTACRSARCSSPTTRPPPSSPATTPRPSAATRSPAPPPAPSSSTIDDELLAHVRALGERFARRASRRPRRRAPARDRARTAPRCPVAHAALERNLLVGTAGETALRLTPPLTLSDERGRAGDRAPRELLA